MYFDVYMKINGQTLHYHIPEQIICSQSLFIWAIKKILKYKIVLTPVLSNETSIYFLYFSGDTTIDINIILISLKFTAINSMSNIPEKFCIIAPFI